MVSYRLTDELDTVGPCDFDGTLHVFTPPIRNEITAGELRAVSYSFARGRRCSTR